MRGLALILLATALGLAPRPVHAQGPAAIPAGCTYRTCALRLETGFWHRRLVRGEAGETVGKPLGDFGKGVDVLLAGPDSAATHARSYVHDSRWTSALGLVAAAAYGVVLYRTDSFQHGDRLGNEGVAAAIVGGTAGVITIPFALRAQRELSRAVWWYNSALPR